MTTNEPKGRSEARPPADPFGTTNEEGAPRWLFALQLGYVGALLLFLLLYHHSPFAQRLVPDPAGPIPLGVVWWGALGGVSISLTGIFRHPRDWDETYNWWHVARPLLGAAMGTVGYLVFVVVAQAASTEGAEAGSSSPVFYLVGFLLGYREQVFRDVLRKAVDVLIAPGRNAD